MGLPSKPSKSEGLPPVEAGEASPLPTLRKFPRAAVASDGEQGLYCFAVSRLKLSQKLETTILILRQVFHARPLPRSFWPKEAQPLMPLLLPSSATGCTTPRYQRHPKKKENPELYHICNPPLWLHNHIDHIHQSMGLGGGFLMTVYTRATGITEVLNAREMAPAFANPHM